jgi:hypothetical protein
MSTPERTFTVRTGVRYGQWLFNRADNTIQCFGDFDGDGLDEIFITSPWGIGMLKWVNNIVTSTGMRINGSNLNGYVVDNKHVFGSVGNYLANKNQEIIVHNKTQLQAVLVLKNGNLEAVNATNKNLVFGELTGEFVAKLDRDEKTDWLFKNDGAIFIANLDETKGIEINNIIGPKDNNNLQNWTINTKDVFVSAGNFMNKAGEQQVLIVAGKSI